MPYGLSYKLYHYASTFDHHPDVHLFSLLPLSEDGYLFNMINLTGMATYKVVFYTMWLMLMLVRTHKLR